MDWIGDLISGDLFKYISIDGIQILDSSLSFLRFGLVLFLKEFCDKKRNVII